DAASYTTALQKVAARGWLVEEDGRFTITNEGKQLRQAVEDETDRLFYAPWPLNKDELANLQALMEAVRDGLKPPEFKDTWKLMGDVQTHIGAHFSPVMQDRNKAVGFEGWDLAITRRADVVEAGVTVSYMRGFAAYYRSETISERLEQVAARGFIERTDGDGYVATEKGRQGAKLVMDAAETAVSELTQLSDEKMDRLSSLLGKWSDGFANAEAPTKKPALQDSQQFSATPIQPIMWQINRYMADGFSFRDDAHVAAWKAYDVPDYQWEAFSHVWGEKIWGDKVSTAAAVAEKLGFRGYDEAAYTAVLTDC
ncbi:MAG: hypothetical protein GY943_16650, partial [Chloroflexi bacterium]|nr:hypothetical protein [Chloroflexota bacterium]